ncbi:MAG TPA: sulfotransferase [Capillimicrobium sp.]|nr:sulfotransferase [Capillimicrobium sp.]
MSWKDTVNRTLSRATGHELRRVRDADGKRIRAVAPPPAKRTDVGDRLLVRPAFVLSSVRSGSTLLRVVLDSHSQIHSPPEMHLRDISVKTKSKYVDRTLTALKLDERSLEYLLWDRLLHRELTRHGKRQLVNKTPNDVFIVDRIRECWPDARLVFLLRHPAAIEASRMATRVGKDTPERNREMVLKYISALEDARTRFDGLTVKYEEMATEPERVTRELCAFLGLEWEPSMLDYGRHDRHFKPGLGDWKDKIKSGRIQPPTPPPAEVHPDLMPFVEAWGY